MEENLSVRLPSDLKRAIEASCAITGRTITAFVRDAVARELSPPNRAYQLPGLSESFDTFLASPELRNRLGRALLLVIDEGGNRAMYSGYISFNASQGGLVGISVAGRDNPPWVLLRKHIAAWFSADHDFGDMISFLQRQGWFLVSYPPR